MYKGKAIYNPSGKAGEYSYLACNFYVGCSNGCTYCYLKTGVLAHAMGGDKPVLKKCFKDETHALEVFEKELLQNIDELRKHGLFFTFTSDPMLPETIGLTLKAFAICLENEVPIKILTKCTNFIQGIQMQKNETVSLRFPFSLYKAERKFISIGFTLTGHDELEPGASTNADRIQAMKKLHDAGFKTFASIEPIIDFTASKDMIIKTLGFCDLYKIGLESGKKYPVDVLKYFVVSCMSSIRCNHSKAYFKDSIVSALGVSREDIKQWKFGDCIVERDYNLFTGSDECLVKCTSCDKDFDIEDITYDGDDNPFCPECWKVLAPDMQAEYEELKANGEID